MNRGHYQFVCADCFEDPALQHFVREHVVESRCDFCGREEEGNAISADVEGVVNYIRDRLEEHFSDNSVECIPFDQEEDDYFLPVFDTRSLFYEELGGFPTSNNDLIQFIVDSLPDREWCHKDPGILSRYEGLKLGWEEFCRAVKHHTRFLFFQKAKHRPDEIGYEPNAVDPGEMLGELEELIRRFDLIRDLGSSQEMIRVRCHSTRERYTTPAQLGPPPEEAARATRMSPAGIPVFYAAEELDTALAETRLEKEPAASIGIWRVIEPIRVLNLAELPEIPSIYDPTPAEETQLRTFLWHFRNSITSPTKPDKSEHLEYVPSQIVTEYLRLRYSDERGAIHGIKYPSARNRKGTNFVLFFDQSAIEGAKSDSIIPHRPWLRLVGTDYQELA